MSETADEFFATFRSLYGGAIVCEPRHESWFAAAAERMLRAHGVARVAADPARVPVAADPGGDPRLAYFRLHGSPRIYYSDYEPGQLASYARRLEHGPAVERWCIFDNTTLGFATGNALALARLLAAASRHAGAA